MQNNFIKKKPSQNSQLLTLLINRQKSKSMSCLKGNDWPGKISPSFTSTIRIQTADLKQQKIQSQRNSLNQTRPMYIRQIPTVRASIQGQQLALKPRRSSLIFIRTNKTGLSSRSSRNYRTRSTKRQNLIRFKENEGQIKMSQIFKNTKISDKVNQLIDLKLTDAQRTTPTKKKIKVISSTLTNMSNLQPSQPKIQTARTAQPLRERAKTNFKVDFITFGYIQKVIDNPQLWTKYVHKVDQIYP